MILPECRWMWEGIEGADSLVMNPHKWLGVPFDCSLYYVRDPQHLERVMSTNPSYLRSTVDNSNRPITQHCNWSIPLGCRFRALKLWTLIRLEGVEGLQTRLRRDLSYAQWFADQVRLRLNWQVVAPVPLQTICIRHVPPGLSGEALDQHTLDWVDRVNRSGDTYLSPAILNGRWMVRVSVGAYATEWHDIEAAWKVIYETAEASFEPYCNGEEHQIHIEQDLSLSKAPTAQA
jgi:aromatic-L-amino-acid/L-tryptophan decarboxylase